ncbi:MAG: thermonuclease family protein [Chloroflexota bacterium]|nr:thermonuclease family protein [Chloroflexota bacterium]
MRRSRAVSWVVWILVAFVFTACVAPAAEPITQPGAAERATSAPLVAAGPTNTPRPTPTCYEQGGTYVDQLNVFSQDWDEVIAVATATPAERLQPYIEHLQDIRRETEALRAPACWLVAHAQFLAMMDAAIQGYQDRHAQQPVNVVNESFQTANLHLEAFTTEVDRLEDEWLQSLTGGAAAETANLPATSESLNLSEPTNLPEPTSVPPTATPVPPTATPELQQVATQVIDIVDGDTIKVLMDGQVYTVRLIGMDTPETKHPSKPVECFGQEASVKAYELLTGQMVYLEADPSQDDRDRYNRLLRYVWLPDGRLFNQEMIAQGYAYEYTYDLPYKYQAEFKQAQQQADAQDLGLWAPTTCNGERVATQPAPEPAPVEPVQPVEPAPIEPAPIEPEPIEPAPLVFLQEPGVVAAGAMATVGVQTSPGTTCSITVEYKSGPSKAAGLEAKQAGGDGSVWWTWKVGTNTTPGIWPVYIGCGDQSVSTAVIVQ